MTHYTNHARLAIGIGALATTGALAILLAEPIGASWRGDHAQWRLDHFLLPTIVAITIAAGHLCGKALRELRPAAIGFALLFAVGTGLTVYSSVGAQRAAGDMRSAQAAADNKGLIAKWADLERAKTRLTMAETMADKEMTGERCGRRCQDWQLRATEIGANIQRIEADISRMGSERVAPPGKAAVFADAMAVLGYDRGNVERIARTFEPFAFALLFELTAIVAFGYGFGGRRPTSAGTNVVPFRRPEPQAITERPEGELTDAEIEEAAKHINRDGVMNRTLARQLGVSEGQATKIVDAGVAAGKFSREVDPNDKRRVIIRKLAA